MFILPQLNLLKSADYWAFLDKGVFAAATRQGAGAKDARRGKQPV